MSGTIDITTGFVACAGAYQVDCRYIWRGGEEIHDGFGGPLVFNCRILCTELHRTPMILFAV